MKITTHNKHIHYTPQQLAQIKRSARKAGKVSYNKQRAFLEKYPEDFSKALEFSK